MTPKIADFICNHIFSFLSGAGVVALLWIWLGDRDYRE